MLGSKGWLTPAREEGSPGTGQDISLHDCPGSSVPAEELWSGTLQHHWDRDWWPWAGLKQGQNAS